MKKLCVPLLALLLALLTACGAGPAPENGYSPPPVDELLAMDDDALFEELMFYCFDHIESVNGPAASNEQKTLFTLMNLQLEVENGGLCQFFANTSRACAPYVSEALEQAGADKIQKLFNDFVAENNIDVNDLSDFDAATEADFAALYDKYDFDAFDDAFYADGDGLFTFIVEYARNHINEIVR